MLVVVRRNKRGTNKQQTKFKQTNKQINKQTQTTEKNGLFDSVVEVEVTVPQVAIGSNPLVYIQEKNILIKPASGAHHGAHHVHTIHHPGYGVWCDGVRQPRTRKTALSMQGVWWV